MQMVPPGRNHTRPSHAHSFSSRASSGGGSDRAQFPDLVNPLIDRIGRRRRRSTKGGLSRWCLRSTLTLVHLGCKLHSCGCIRWEKQALWRPTSKVWRMYMQNYLHLLNAAGSNWPTSPCKKQQTASELWPLQSSNLISQSQSLEKIQQRQRVGTGSDFHSKACCLCNAGFCSYPLIQPWPFFIPDRKVYSGVRRGGISLSPEK